MNQNWNGSLSENIRFFDNLLSPTHFKNCLDAISSPNFPWFFQPDTTYGSKNNTDSINHGFRHSLIKDGESNSDWVQLFLPIAWIMADKLNLEISNVYSMHLNLMENYNKTPPPRPHIDRERDSDDIDKMFTGVFYFDSVDGDTVFYAEDREEIIHRQTPSANSLVIFPAKTWHSATNPMVHPYRRVLNINLTMK